MCFVKVKRLVLGFLILLVSHKSQFSNIYIIFVSDLFLKIRLPPFVSVKSQKIS